jgi:SAM-dependent methyltransferase
MSKQVYVHGYSKTEADRLSVQADTLNEILYGDTVYPPGSLVLEAGCGVGAQTGIIAKNSPGAKIISVDISRESLAAARKKADADGNSYAEYLNCDIFGLPFPEKLFDAIFVCFVLEHLQNPGSAVSSLLKLLKPGGTMTVIEGDHGSAFFYPESCAAKKAIDCLVLLQAKAGGDAAIGRRLYPLLNEAGLSDVCVSPRIIYADNSNPSLVDGFTKKTFTAMVKGVGDDAVSSKIITKEEWDRGIEGLYRTTEKDGTFCYTFFKATGRRMEE